MKLLLDENVSRRVLPKIIEGFPDSIHLANASMLSDNDFKIWEYAAENDFAIVSKDKDFIQLSTLRGHPPKIIHLATGNGPIDEIVDILLANVGQIKAFGKHASKSYLVLDRI